jgi:hypothetical protein
MIDKNRKKEGDIRVYVLIMLSHHSKLTTQQITNRVKDRVKLSGADLSRANERPNECKFDQIVANALHSERTLCKYRLIRRIGRGVFEITDRGRQVLAEWKKRSGE